MLGADLKVSVHPRIHWIVSAIAGALLIPYLIRTVLVPYICISGKLRPVPAIAPACLLVFAILVPTCYGADIISSFGEAAKLVLILIVGLTIFTSEGNLAKYAFKGFEAAVWLNLSLYLFGLLGAGTASAMGAGRWGTLFDYPGSLWRMAIATWVFSLYLIIKKRSIHAFALAIASGILIFADGARSGILFALAGALYVIFVAAAETEQLRRAIVSILCGAAGLMIVMGTLVIISRHAEGQDATNGLTRMSNLVGSSEAGTAGLGAADVVRFYMIKHAVDEIQSHPFFGTGVQTTVLDTIFGPIVVHMTYLQVWADLGLFGLAAYVWLVWGWVPRLTHLIRRTRTLPNLQEKATYYNAIFLLMVFGAAGFFHPLSTEFAEWILFLIPYALLSNFALSDRLPSNRTAHGSR